MALMDYGRCRKYNQYVRFLREHCRVSIDVDTVRSFYSPAQYAQLINAKLDQFCNNSSQKRKIIKEMKSYATLHIVPEKYFDWVKSDRRIACYAWFQIIGNPEILPEKESVPLFINPVNNRSVPNVYGEDIIGQYSGNVDFESLSKQIKKGEIKNENDSVQLINSDLSLEFEVSVISHLANGINFERFTPVNDSKEGYLLSLMKEIDSLQYDINEKINIIHNLYRSWVKVFNEISSPFSWIDLDDDENIRWLWSYMSKSYVGCDARPATIRQMKDFAIATFDCWAGWSGEQAGILKVQDGIFTPGMIKSKKEFLARARNSWIQKRHREKKAKDSSGIKLTALSKKKLMALCKVTGIEPNVLLNSYVEDAWKRMKSEQND